MMKPIYLAGDLLYGGSQLLRAQEVQKLKDAGLPVYAPHEDKEINDKTNQTKDSNDGLAEKIVANDTIAIKKANTVIIEPQRFAEGTLVELGQIKAYNELRRTIIDMIADDCTLEDIVRYLIHDMPHKTVYAHLNDIRRTDIPETGDRRSFYINQYVYGTILELTNGIGFTPFDDIVKQLKCK